MSSNSSSFLISSQNVIPKYSTRSEKVENSLSNSDGVSLFFDIFIMAFLNFSIYFSCFDNSLDKANLISSKSWS